MCVARENESRELMDEVHVYMLVLSCLCECEHEYETVCVSYFSVRVCVMYVCVLALPVQCGILYSIHRLFCVFVCVN